MGICDLEVESPPGYQRICAGIPLPTFFTLILVREDLKYFLERISDKRVNLIG
jgi:hypothetical protein